MAFGNAESFIVESFTNVDSVQKYPLGMIVRGIDPTLGGGEFIYLKGVGSTAAGSVVTYDLSDGSTTLAPATAGLGCAVAVAMAATIASTYGWYQISGYAKVNCSTCASGGLALYLAGSGALTTSAANGKEVLGILSGTATGTPATGFIYATINRPVAQGQAV